MRGRLSFSIGLVGLVGLIGVITMFSGCANHSVEHYDGHEPAMNVEEYLNGEIEAWGLVQDWRGRVVNRFDLTLKGEWYSGVGTLTEKFNYYNGTEQQRVWTIHKVEDQRYEGHADDILGGAQGTVSGNAVKWTYVMDVPVGNKRYKIHFDDWMWQMNGGVVINRSYLKKFGFTVAELSLFMKKVTQ